MSFDPSVLFFGIVIGSIGLALFIYGKKQSRFPQLGVGLALMVFPYFTSGGVRPQIVIASLLLLGLWWMLRLGW